MAQSLNEMFKGGRTDAIESIGSPAPMPGWIQTSYLPIRALSGPIRPVMADPAVLASGLAL